MVMTTWSQAELPAWGPGQGGAGGGAGSALGRDVERLGVDRPGWRRPS